MPATPEPFVPIHDRLAASAGSFVVEDGAGKEVRGHAFLDFVGRAAAYISSLGVKPGDRVLVQVPKSIEALALYFATLRTGAVFTPVDDRVPVGSVEAVIDDALPALAVATKSTIDGLASKLRISRVRVAMSLEADGSGSFTELARGQQPARSGAGMRASELAAVCYPLPPQGHAVRGIKLVHGALARQVAMVQRHFALVPEDVMVHALADWADPASLAYAGAALLAGARLVWCGRAGGRTARGADRATTILVGDEQGLMPGGKSHLRLTLRKAAASAAGAAGRYVSLAETGVLCAAADDGLMHLLASGSARLRDAAGNIVASAGEGRLEIAGEHVFTGYWRLADATRAAFTGDAFFITGLRGRRLDDGAIVVVGPQP